MNENPTPEHAQSTPAQRPVRETMIIYAVPNPRATELATFSTPFAWRGGWEYIDELHRNEWGMWQGVRLSDCRMGWAHIALKPIVQVVRAVDIPDTDWPGSRSVMHEGWL